MDTPLPWPRGIVAALHRFIRSVRASTLPALALASIAIVSAAEAQTIEEAVRLYRQGRVAEAIDAFRAAARAAESTDPAAAGRARNNACVLLMNRGEHAEALVECENALRLRRDGDDPRSLGRTLNNLGLVLEHLGRYEEAETHLKEALAINEARDDIQAQVVNRGNLGLVASRRGDYDEALRFHTSAADLAAAHREQPWSLERWRIARINVGVVLEELGAFRRALDTYQEALAEGEGEDQRRDATLQMNIGVVYRNLGDPVAALAAFERVRSLSEQLGDNVSLSTAWLNIALAEHVNLRRFDDAESAYRKATGLARRTGDRSETIRALSYFGDFLNQRERWDEASAVFEESLKLADESDSAPGRVAALAGLGRVAEGHGDLPKALARFESAMAELEEIREGISEASLRSSYFLDKRSTYASAVRVLDRLRQTHADPELAAKALDVVQRAKLRELVEALGDAAVPRAPLPSAEILDVLGDTLVLEYFVGEESLYVWSLGAHRIEMHDLGPAEPILDAVATNHDALAEGEPPSPDTLSFLSQKLLAPLEATLAGARAVRIAPDGRLWYLPFEILELPSQPAPLVDVTTVTYLPSASAAAWLSDDEASGPITLVGMGDPEVAPSRAETSAGLLAARFRLSALPAAQEELSDISRLLPGEHEIRRGTRATEDELRRLAGLAPRIIHFATHTVIDEGRGRGPAILLTPDEADDGLLYSDEIAKLDYHVGLTVLASCRTSLGSPDDGRALASLTGSFLAAGSSAVLATLWDVGDAATEAFMEQFYYFLSRGLEPEEALRNAKLRFRSDPEWDDPSLWAAYVLVGDSPALIRAPWRSLAWGGALLAVLALVVASAYTVSKRATGR